MVWTLVLWPSEARLRMIQDARVRVVGGKLMQAVWQLPARTAQGGGGSFKDKKPT